MPNSRRRISLLVVVTATLFLAIAMQCLPVAGRGGASAARPRVADFAQTGPSEPLGHLFGWMASINVPPAGGSYAYFGEGSGLTTFDVSDPANLTQVSGLPLGSGDVVDMAFAGSHGYVLNGDALHVVDLADPSNPQLLGTQDVEGWAMAVATFGNYAYILANENFGDTWLRVIDVSSPSGPAHVSDVDVVGYGDDILAQDGYLFAWNRDQGLQVFDLAQPEAPVQVANRAVSSNPGHLAIAGTTVYCAAGSLYAIDVTDPEHPSLLGTHRTSNAAQVAVSDSTAYVARGSQGVDVVNVANPASPQRLTTHVGDLTAQHLGLVGSTLLYGDETQGVVALDVSSPSAPVVIDTYLRPSNVADACLAPDEGPLAYYRGSETLASSGSQLIYLVSDADFWTATVDANGLATIVGSCPLPANDWQPTLCAHGTRAYVGIGDEGVAIIDVTNPASPTVRAHYRLPGNPKITDLATDGEYVFAACANGTDGRLCSIDVRNEALVQQADVLDTPGSAAAVEVAAGVAYLADGSGGVRIVNVSDPTDLSELSHTAPKSLHSTDAVCIDGDQLYVGSNGSGGWWLQHYDVSDPAAPAFVEEVRETQGEVSSIAVFGDVLKVTAPGGSLAEYIKMGLALLGWNHTSGSSGSITFSPFPGLTITLIIKRSYGITTTKYVQTGGSPTSTPATHTPEVTPTTTSTPGCSVVGVIQPGKAQSDGCTVSPFGAMPCVCTQPIAWGSSAVNGWVFDRWEPANKDCPQDGSKTVTGFFQPTGVLAGGETLFLCLSEEHLGETVLPFSFSASQADSWEVTRFAINIACEGDCPAVSYPVKLFLTSPTVQQLGETQTYGGGTQTLTFSFPKVVIPASGTRRFAVRMDIPEGECEGDAANLDISVSSHDLQAENYKPGVPSGSAASEVGIGCVWNDDLSIAYGQIQEAVDEAADYHSIDVCPGTYNENVTIPKALAVTSLGSREETIIQAKSAGQHAVHVQASDVTFDGFTVKGATGQDRAGIALGTSAMGHAPQRLTAVSGVSIMDCIVEGNNHGVLVSGVSDAESEVWSCLIRNNNLDGVYLGATTQMQFSANTVSGNKRNGAFGGWGETYDGNTFDGNKKHGIYINNDGVATVTGNTIKNNTQSGIFISDCEQMGKVDIHANTIGPDNQDGITVGEEDVWDAKIRGNSIKKNKRYGVHIKSEGRNTLVQEANQFDGNAEYGVYCEESGIVEITDNTFTGNKNGVGLKDSVARIENNTMTGDAKAGAGVEIVDDADLAGMQTQIYRNTISGFGRGVHIKASEHTLVGDPGKANTITGNATGIYVENCPGTEEYPTRIVANTLTGNDTYGVHLKNTCGVVVGPTNIIGPNTQSGVYVDSCDCRTGSGNTIKNNTISGNTQSGVLLIDSCANTVGPDNTLETNGQHGVHLNASECEGKPNTVTGNTIRNNAGHGVVLERSKYNVVHENKQIGPGHRFGVYSTYSANNVIRDEPKIEGNTEAGVSYFHADFEKLENSTIVGNGSYGVHIEYSNDTIVSAYVEGCTIKDHKIGVFVDHSCGARIGSAVRENAIGPNSEAGVKIADSTCSWDARNEVQNSVIDNCGYGVFVTNSANTAIGDEDANTIRNSGQNGIHLERTDRWHIQNNTVYNNSRSGIAILNCDADASGSELTGNTVRDNSAYGVYVYASKGVLVGADNGPANVIRTNGSDGVQINQCKPTSASPVAVLSNEIGPDNSDGVQIEGSNGVRVAKNTIRSNDKNGVYVARSEKTIIEENDPIRENGECGVKIKWSTGTDVRKNHIAHNSLSGVYLYEADDNGIPREIKKPNHIEHNGEDGIRLDASKWNRFAGNQINNNARDGMRFSYSRRNDVVGENTIEANGGNGLLLEGSSWNRFLTPFPTTTGSGGTRVTTYHSLIYDNGDDGVQVRSASVGNVMRYYKIKGHGGDYGIYIKGSQQNTFDTCQVSWNWRGIVDEGAHNETRTCILLFNTFAHSGIHVDGADTLIEGCTIMNDAGSGIVTLNGAQPTIRECNIVSNTVHGLLNLNPETTVTADDNWWGDEDGPSVGTAVSGTVSIDAWRSMTVTLHILAPPDEIVRPGDSVTLTWSAVNWDEAGNVRVVVTDTLGWLQGGTSTVASVNPVAEGDVLLQIPVDAAQGTVDEIRFAATWEDDEGITDDDTCRITVPYVAVMPVTLSELENRAYRFVTPLILSD